MVINRWRQVWMELGMGTKVLQRLYVGGAFVCIFLAAVILVGAIVPRYDELSTVTTLVREDRGQPTLEIAEALDAIGWTPSTWAYYFTTLETLVGISFVLVGVLILWNRHEDWYGVFIAVGLATFGTITFHNSDAFLVAYPEWEVLFYTLRGISYITFLVSLFLFPDGRFFPRFTRWIAVVIVFYVVITLGFIQEWAPTRQIFTDPTPHDNMVYALSIGWPCLGAMSLVYRYTQMSDPTERLRTKLIIASLAWALATLVMGSVLYVVIRAQIPDFTPEVLVYRIVFMSSIWINLILIAMAFGVSILHYKLWNIDLIINRTLVYGILSVLIIGIYIVVVGGLSVVFHASSGQIFPLIATGIVAISFHGLRERVQRAVNRMMFGQRDDPQAVLAQLSERLQSAILPEELLTSTVGIICNTLKLPYAAISIRRGADIALQVEQGENRTPTQSLALNYHNEEVGQLVVGRRSPNEALATADRTVLESIARQMGAVVYAVRLQSELQQARERLVIAREEERRRLRRDLHDGLGPALASQTLKLDTAIELFDTHSQDVRKLLVDVRSQSDELIMDIRRIVHDLRPPALDELGLEGALENAIARMNSAGRATHIQFESALDCELVAAAVQSAAYWIILEAITNVMKHAEARKCRVKLGCVAKNRWLQISIEDDGVGLPMPISLGVGLQSMRERAEELGGQFRLELSSLGGTQVVVCLPLTATNQMHQ